MAFGKLGARGGFGGLGARGGGGQAVPAPAAPALTWTSNSTTLLPTFDVSGLFVTGDIMQFELQTSGGDWSSLIANTTHTVTAGEISGTQIDFGLSALSAGSYDARVRFKHQGGTYSDWSNVTSKTLTSSALTYTVTDVSKAWDNAGYGFGTPFNTTVNIGPVTADRTIVAAIGLRSNSGANGSPTGSGNYVRLGGIDMTPTSLKGESSSGQSVYLYTLAAPAGVLNATSAVLSVLSTFIEDIVVSVGIITGSGSTSVNDTKGSTWSQALNPRGVSNDFAALTVNAGGLIVVAGLGDRNTITWASANETVDMTNPNAGGGTFAFLQAHGTNASPAFTDANNFFACFTGAAFTP